ncbi:hypothetical protein WJX72_006128 [[Myrmecia] bisecta]|uniref:Uncharacterized protein n=1 Tax=[Myrmecia] bisecta TaxID=41462 RepID=A0AAW1R787_9CHLO
MAEDLPFRVFAKTNLGTTLVVVLGDPAQQTVKSLQGELGRVHYLQFPRLGPVKVKSLATSLADEAGNPLEYNILPEYLVTDVLKNGAQVVAHLKCLQGLKRSAPGTASPALHATKRAKAGGSKGHM